MDKNKWNIIQSGGEVYICYYTFTTVNGIIIPVREYLLYDGTVRADSSAFSWKVWQASPGSDLFLYLSILATVVINGADRLFLLQRILSRS